MRRANSPHNAIYRHAVAVWIPLRYYDIGVGTNVLRTGRITVHNDGRLVFTFTNGSEETVMM